MRTRNDFGQGQYNKSQNQVKLKISQIADMEDHSAIHESSYMIDLNEYIRPKFHQSNLFFLFNLVQFTLYFNFT